MGWRMPVSEQEHHYEMLTRACELCAMRACHTVPAVYHAVGLAVSVAYYSLFYATRKWSSGVEQVARHKVRVLNRLDGGGGAVDGAGLTIPTARTIFCP